MGLGQDPRISSWAHNGLSGMSSSLFAGDAPDAVGQRRDLYEGQNLTSTNAPSASSFLESLNEKEGSRIIPSFGITFH